MSLVRDAQAGELGVLAALARDHPGYQVSDLSQLQARPGGLILTTGPESLLVAEVVLDQAELHLVVVDPSARRRGLGTLLVEALQVRAQALGAQALYLEVASRNRAAVALYERQGFRSVGRRRGYYRDGDDALLYQRDLG